jgi:hypothetical protein
MLANGRSMMVSPKLLFMMSHLWAFTDEVMETARFVRSINAEGSAYPGRAEC